MNVTHIEGRISSGKGEGARFIELPWVKQQIAQKVGFTPYLGTLNIVMTEDAARFDRIKEKAKSIEITPAEGFHRGKCIKACLNDDLKCAIIIPEVSDYPKDVMEIIAPANLRRKLDLKDGDIVQVKIEHW